MWLRKIVNNKLNHKYITKENLTKYQQKGGMGENTFFYIYNTIHIVWYNFIPVSQHVKDKNIIAFLLCSTIWHNTSLKMV